jgi:hypothetical protein
MLREAPVPVQARRNAAFDSGGRANNNHNNVEQQDWKTSTYPFLHGISVGEVARLA